MIDLHVHSIYSDGNCDIKTLLEMAEKNKLDVFSITDHNTVEAHIFDVPKYRAEFSGNFISGCEVLATYGDEVIEILTFGFDVHEFDKFLEIYFCDEVVIKALKEDLKFVYDKADKMKLVYNKVDFDKLTGHDKLCRVFNIEVARHEENRGIYMEDCWNNNGNFDRRYIRNPNSEWYIKKSKIYPTAEEVIQAAHNAGGLTFIAHPLECRTKMDIYKLMDELKEKGLDGIEVYHISAMGEGIDKLEQYAIDKGFYMSGGSDFHRTNHPTKTSMIGSEENELKAEKDIVKNWIEKIS